MESKSETELDIEVVHDKYCEDTYAYAVRPVAVASNYPGNSAGICVNVSYGDEEDRRYVEVVLPWTEVLRVYEAAKAKGLVS